MTQFTGRTTTSSIELNNLTSQINAATRSFDARPDDLAARTRLAGFLLLRARVVGQSADLARAVTLAEEAVEKAPDDPQALLLRARGRASAHRFTEALADLDAAEAKLRPEDPKVPYEIARGSMLVAVGRYDDALPILQRRARLEPTTQTLGDYAALLGKLGMYKEAEAQFVEAELKFRGVSPLPLVELYFDRASMWEKSGDLALATNLYRAAHKRFPEHVHVAVHLAALVPPSEAVEILEPLAERSDDPDLFAQLGRMKNMLAPGSGDAHVTKAKGLYEDHFAKLPEAYADHAGWFWVGLGRDPRRALDAANVNLAQRKTAEAYELAFAAADAVADLAAKCDAYRGATALKHPSPKLKEVLARLDGKIACPDSGITPSPSTAVSAGSR